MLRASLLALGILISGCAHPEEPAMATPASDESRDVSVNDVKVDDEQVLGLERMYRTHVQNGAYWYDRMTGAWGAMRGPTLGFILPGLALGGTLRADASNGDTGVFINGRELHRIDVHGLMQLGAVYPGRYWVDAYGNFGFEGGAALGNLWRLARQRAASGAQGGGPWAVYSGYAGGSGGVAAGDGSGGLYAQFGDLTWSN